MVLCEPHRLTRVCVVHRAQAAAFCVNAALAYAGIEDRVSLVTDDEVNKKAIRAGLSSLVGRLLLIPGRPNLRTDKATELQILGPRNVARTAEFTAGRSTKHPVAMHPVVWLFRDSGIEGDDACLALLLPLCEEGYNLPGSERVCLPGQNAAYEDVWVPCTVLHVYDPKYTWSNFQGNENDIHNPWSKDSRLLRLPGDDRPTPAPRDYFGWKLYHEGRKERDDNEGGRLMSVAKMQQGSTRTLGPDVPIYAGADVLRQQLSAGALDDALRDKMFAHDKLVGKMGKAEYYNSFAQEVKETLGVEMARRLANPCGLDLRMYLLQRVLLSPTPLAPLLTNTLVDAETLKPLLPPLSLSSVPGLWAKLQAASTPRLE